MNLTKQSATLAGSGLAIYNDRISAAHSIASEIFDTLRRLDEQMYEPKPIPSTIADKPTAPPTTIEAQLTILVERLRDINSLANKLLNG